MRYEELDIDRIELDIENPRIKHYLSIYKDDVEITSERLAMALAGNADGISKYTALKESIRENGGIFTPIIVNHITSEDRYVVIEGNTRLKFYSEFREKKVEGSWDKIISIVYEDMPLEQIHAIRLQAHMVGARDWDAFSKAKYLDHLRNVENKSWKYLKAFCGGQESYIRNLIDAYNDMMKSNIPLGQKFDRQFDPREFSYYMELQKGSTKDALTVHNFNLDDFTKWVFNENIERADEVRKLARVLGDNEAREKFLRSNISEAVKILDTHELSKKKINKINRYELVNELRDWLYNMPVVECEALKANNEKAKKRREDLQDLKYWLDYVIEKIGEE